MEYIREMLLRQRTALARLLLGGAPEEAAETASAPAAVRQKEMAREEQGTGSVEAASAGRGARRRVAAGAAGESATDTAVLAWETLRQELSRKRAARERAVLSSLAGAGETVLPLPASYRRSAGEESGSAGRAGVTWIGGDGETEPAGALPEFRRPGGTGSGAGAKALSRAFQRDARRYDGGFQLYD